MKIEVSAAQLKEIRLLAGAPRFRGPAGCDVYAIPRQRMELLRAVLDTLEGGMNNHDLLLAIQSQLSAVEWSADTLEEIAELMARNGYPIRDIAEEAEEN